METATQPESPGNPVRIRTISRRLFPDRHNRYFG
jgi:hypothetical protein